MKPAPHFEVTTVNALKANVFDAIEQGIVLNRADTASYEAFDAAIDAYVEAWDGAVAPQAVPAARTRRAWLTEVTRIIHQATVLNAAH